MSDSELSIDPVFGCEIWGGKLDADGYGLVLRRGRRPQRAHRYVWERRVGPIAEALVLDHLCRRRACCAPAHLEAIDQSENERRKSWRYRAKRAHCGKGHDLRISAMVTPEGGRVCRVCSKPEQHTGESW